MVSKHVMCPPLKTVNLEFFIHSWRSCEDSHVCVSQFPIFAVTFSPGIPKLIMLFVSSSLSTGIIICVSFALVPNGPLIGAKMCFPEPFMGVVPRKLPTNSTFSLRCILSKSPRLYSQTVYGGGLSGIIIFEHCFT